MQKKQRLKSIGLYITIVVFTLWTIPKIIAYFNPSDLVIVGKSPDFSLINQHGDSIQNTFYDNKVYLLEFFFTSCPGICITMNKNLMRIQNKFLGEPNFGIASITVDPIHDTPTKLLEYARKHNASKNWNFMTGDKSKIYQLANEGFNLYAGLNENIEGGFEHSGLFALIDNNGLIRCRKDAFNNPIIYYDGLDNDNILMLIEDIKSLLK